MLKFKCKALSFCFLSLSTFEHHIQPWHQLQTCHAWYTIVLVFSLPFLYSIGKIPAWACQLIHMWQHVVVIKLCDGWEKSLKRLLASMSDLANHVALKWEECTSSPLLSRFAFLALSSDQGQKNVKYLKEFFLLNFRLSFPSHASVLEEVYFFWEDWKRSQRYCSESMTDLNGHI